MLMTPKEKKKKDEAQQKTLKEKVDRLRKDFDAVAATEEGMNVFNYLLNSLGFHKNTVTMDPQTGEVNKDASVYLEARRSVYVEIRKYISPKYLKKIEFS